MGCNALEQKEKLQVDRDNCVMKKLCNFYFSPDSIRVKLRGMRGARLVTLMVKIFPYNVLVQ